MSLHPFRALDHVIDEYRDYLRTEFRAKDPGLREALGQALDQPLFLAQEPFFQAHRPFRSGKPWQALPIDPKLARVMEARSGSEHAYLHQAEAIGELLAPNARPVVVTTGTGSGKTEAFLLPVIQNAIEDAVRFKQNGLTAILVYPMNALANDQLLRIQEYLRDSGFSGTVTVRRYDRGTPQAEREAMRKNPPHILLTNYMMLEYLLVRPTDREGLFANHRCRFLVLDEVHTYRGTLGSHIALLVRRLRTHLEQAKQDWYPNVPADHQARRYPSLVPVGTSATIKSIAEAEHSYEEALRLRDEAVQTFFATLTGSEPASIRVFGEEIEEMQAPSAASYPVTPTDPGHVNIDDPESARAALCTLAGLPGTTSLTEAMHQCRLLWDLNLWLTSAPMSISQIVTKLRQEVASRSEVEETALRREVEAALIVGAALPDNIPGALRLRAHRFIRGGWRFHRCVQPECGRLYPMGEERCECGSVTAPLYLCRNCGADYLRFVGDPDEGPLRPSATIAEGPEHMLYAPGRFEVSASDDEFEDEEDVEMSLGARPARRRSGHQAPEQMRRRPVLHGSFDPSTLEFSSEEADYALQVTLAPARTKCLCCGGTAGSRNVVTPVSLGTSAAVKVMAEGLLEALDEANRDRPEHDDKERLLIFSDSRQDAAHQARFIIFASRYDRMRHHLVRLLDQEGALSIQRAVELLGTMGVEHHDNPYAPEGEDSWLPDDMLHRIQAWEEAPLLDDLAVTAGYRASLLNVGLVGVRYHRLDEYVRTRGHDLATTLGIPLDALEYLCRCLLDEMRVRGALSREMLRYHVAHPSCPAHVRAAEWERRVKQPRGYAATKDGQPLSYLETTEIPQGITLNNAWRRPRAGGRGPSLERILRHLLTYFGSADPNEQTMVTVLDFLCRGSFIIPAELFGYRGGPRKLLQVNAEIIRLVLLSDEQRVRCNVCGVPMPLGSLRFPCPNCHGELEPWPETELDRDRSVRRIRSPRTIPLVAGEHTAQVPNAMRLALEDQFKAPASVSPVNVLACSPTLEMGIDVGGLDAVTLRNVPPRPDNYAQRGGRAGRRSRIGLVVGYARSTPHDQYFYDKPEEMIAGEVPAPALALGNRDVLLRHINAIIFSAVEPGLAGRMVEYVAPSGEVKQAAIDALIEGLKAQFAYGLQMAQETFGRDILAEAGLDEDRLRSHLEQLPKRVQDLMDRTARQVIELRQPLDAFAQQLSGRSAGTRAAELVGRLLGIPTEGQRDDTEADNRSAGYPLRHFAEFGILPGYEFPTEPSALRLWGDPNAHDPITVDRRFGLASFSRMRRCMRGPGVGG